MELGFGVEIELVLQPFKPRDYWGLADWYKHLAGALERRGLDVVHDTLTGQYRKHPEHYHKWFITRDGSLATTSTSQITMEAVSPVMNNSSTAWQTDIEQFWQATRKMFRVQRNESCGSHVHVAPKGRKYSLQELKYVAFAVVCYEASLMKILPRIRQNHPYCQMNTRASSQLANGIRMGSVRNDIKNLTSLAGVVQYMQGDTRTCLWNFRNVTGSGTVEFRGGRHLRGANRTYAWVTLAVAFIGLALEEKLLDGFGAVNTGTVTDLFRKLKNMADYLEMEECLPATYGQMNETQSWT